MNAHSTVLGKSLRPRGPVSLTLARRRASGMTVLQVGGELDLLTAGKLGVEIDDEVRQGEGDVVVDLRKTEFVDSAGLHILLNAQRRLTRQGRGLAVICEEGPVRRVFELAKLIETLNVASNLREHRKRGQARSGLVSRLPAPPPPKRRIESAA